MEEDCDDVNKFGKDFHDTSVGYCEEKRKINGLLGGDSSCLKTNHWNGMSNGYNGVHALSETGNSSAGENLHVETSLAIKALSDVLERATITCGSGKSDSVTSEGRGRDHTESEHLVDEVTCIQYQSEDQMPDIMRLIQKDLSEPYSIYTYRYFIHNWPKLCFLAMYGNKCVGAIVCKLDMHKKVVRRGYIAMLAVDENYRQKKIGSTLVMKAIAVMVEDGADEVVLETEITNEPALRLYENLGFVRDKRLFRYYLNGVDALRLKLWLR
nr:EOG090X07BN [Cyclestheria hislopi]